HWLTAVHHDRDGARGVLGSPGWGASPHHNHFYLQTHQLGRQIGEPLCAALRIAILDAQVLALDIAEVTQPLPEVLPRWSQPSGGAARTEPPDPMHFGRLLRVGDERRREQAQDERDKAPEGAIPHGYLLTSASC